MEDQTQTRDSQLLPADNWRGNTLSHPDTVLTHPMEHQQMDENIIFFPQNYFSVLELSNIQWEPKAWMDYSGSIWTT